MSLLGRDGDVVLLLSTTSPDQGDVTLHEVRRGLNDDMQDRRDASAVDAWRIVRDCGLARAARGGAIAGLDVIVPVRPGDGDTALPIGADAVALTGRQARLILHACNIAKVVVVAHDVGTRFAMRLARDDPARVVAIVAAPATPPIRAGLAGSAQGVLQPLTTTI